MMPRDRADTGRRSTYAGIVSTLAVAVALGAGTAYAGSLIGPEDIKKNAVRSQHIKKNQVTGKHIRAQAVRRKLGVVATGVVVLAAPGPSEPVARRTLARRGPLRLVAECRNHGQAILLVRSAVGGDLFGVQYTDDSIAEPEGLEMLHLPIGDNGAQVAGVAPGLTDLDGASFTARTGGTVLAGEATVIAFGADKCRFTFHGTVR